MACRVKPEGSWQRETELGGSDTRNLRRCAGIDSKRADLNYSNRPVRTRMPGGVGGARSGILTAPIPITHISTRQSGSRMHGRPALDPACFWLLLEVLSAVWERHLCGTVAVRWSSGNGNYWPVVPLADPAKISCARISQRQVSGRHRTLLGHLSPPRLSVR